MSQPTREGEGPAFPLLFAVSSVRLSLHAGLLTVVGVVVNRLNVSIIAFNWQTETYVPRWTEVVITVAIITALILSFRWVVNRMPVLREHPEYPQEE